MKLSQTVFLLIATTAIANATIYQPFTTWADITTKSPDIVIARCAVTAEPGLVNGQTHSEIEVLSVLKGDTKPGASLMVSAYLPVQGERFLIFGTYQDGKFYKGYNATESFRIVPIGRFKLSGDQLKGKSLEEQIQMILRLRLQEVEVELKRHTDEKVRLEAGLKK